MTRKISNFDTCVAYKMSRKLFFTILGGVKGRHLLAAQKYLSEQHGRFPLYPQVAMHHQSQTSWFQQPRHSLTIQPTTSWLWGRGWWCRGTERRSQFSICTRILPWIVAGCTTTRERGLTVEHGAQKVVVPASVCTGAVWCCSAVLHSTVRCDELQLGVGVAVVRPCIVAGRTACYGGFACAGLWAELCTETCVFGGVILCATTGLERLGKGEGEEGGEGGKEESKLHG